MRYVTMAAILMIMSTFHFAASSHKKHLVTVKTEGECEPVEGSENISQSPHVVLSSCL